MDKKDIRDLTLDELREAMAQIDEPAFRASQIFGWLYKKGVYDFNAMRNLSTGTIDKLGKEYCIQPLTVDEHLVSEDGTEKFLFKFSDGNYIETVLIYADGRETICLSTQVGCKYKCAFCASGINGFIRNLTPAEITGQVIYLSCFYRHRITNYVFMGMGEPLDNYDNVSKALMIMNEPEGMGLGQRRITISTCGIIPGIEKLKKLGLQINLSISLHAGSDDLRNKLMPVNKRYPLERLLRACEDYLRSTGRKITFEYILIKGVNDSRKNIDELISIAKRLKAKVNLISFSGCGGLPCHPKDCLAWRTFKSTGRREAVMCMEKIKKTGISVTLRDSKGKDIQAACGQLAGRGRS